MIELQSVGSGLPGQRSNVLRSLPSFLRGLSDEKLTEWSTRYEEGLNKESILEGKLRRARERREAEAENKTSP